MALSQRSAFERSNGDVHLTSTTRCRTDANLAANRARALTHGYETETATRDSGVEATAFVGNPQPRQGTVVLEAEHNPLSTTVPSGICDGLASDSYERLGTGGRQPDARDKIEIELYPASVGDLGRRFGQRSLYGLVPLGSEGMHCPPRLDHRPLGRQAQTVQGVTVRLPRVRIQIAVDVSQLLRHSIVQLTCDTPTVLKDGCFRKRVPIRPDLPHAADKKGQVKSKAENIPVYNTDSEDKGVYKA
jgi:hypothetical protein